MSKVLIIEPHQMLQQAFVLTMSPEDEVCVMSKVEDSDVRNLGDFDLVIVDAAALREADALSPEITRALRISDVPVLWLEERESPQAPSRKNLVVMRKPIEHEAFRGAVTSLLKLQIETEDSQGLTEAGVDKEADDKTRTSETTSAQESFDFIDLTEVVEEATQEKQGDQRAKKS